MPSSALDSDLDRQIAATHARFVQAMAARLPAMETDTKERYFGVLSSHSSLRKEVVPTAPPDRAARAPPPAPGDQLELELEKASTTGARLSPISFG